MINVPLCEVYFFVLIFRHEKSISYLNVPSNGIAQSAYEGGRRTPIVLAEYKFRQEVPK